MWATYPRMSYDQVSAETGISKQSVVDWYSFMRDVCQDWSV